LCKKNTERGSVSIEASISLTTFLFMFIMIYCIIDICICQAKISTSLHNAAKEMSQYCYLYGLTGLEEGFSAIEDSGAGSVATINDVGDKLSTTYSSIQKLASDGEDFFKSDSPDAAQSAWDNIIQSGKEAKDSATVLGSTLGDNLEKFSENPKDVMMGFVRAFASSAKDELISEYVLPPLVRALMKKNLKTTSNKDENVNVFLHRYGVMKENSPSYLKALNLTCSKLQLKEKPEKQYISLCCYYKAQMIPFLPVDKQFTIAVSAVTKPWMHGDGGKVTMKS